MSVRQCGWILSRWCLLALVIGNGQARGDDVLDGLLHGLDVTSRVERITASGVSGGEPLSAGHRLDGRGLTIPDADREKRAFTHDPRIDPAVQALIHIGDHKGIGLFDDAARGLGIRYQDERVLLRFVAKDSRTRERLSRQVEALGGEVTAIFEELAMVRLPTGALRDVPNLDGMLYVAPQSFYRTTDGDMLGPEALGRQVDGPPSTLGKWSAQVARGGGTDSAGIADSQIDRFHRLGITGKGVKIGIIDFGFQRYEALLAAGEVPQPAAARPFNGIGRMDANTVHGTACAEIIHDLAPDASLYLAAIDGSEDQLIAAGRWLARQGVALINFSGGGHEGPHNGLALLDRFVEQMAEEQDVAWIVATGNEGASHWLGRTVDRNGDGLIDVDNPAADGDFLLLKVTRRNDVRVLVYWDDWGVNPSLPAATQDIDVHLFMPTDAGLEHVGGSTRPQNGRGRPLEQLSGEIPAGLYVIGLHAKRLGKPVNIHVMVSSGAATLVPIDPTGSVGSPAISSGALAVGAIDVQSGKVQPYSGRGPTDDGRLKPQVVAPDNRVSIAYNHRGGRFSGTSAACPQVSGLAALIMQQRPGLSRSELYSELIAQARPMGQPVPNNLFGFGLIDAAAGAPLGHADGLGEHRDGIEVEAEIRDFLEGLIQGGAVQ